MLNIDTRGCQSLVVVMEGETRAYALRARPDRDRRKSEGRASHGIWRHAMHAGCRSCLRSWSRPLRCWYSCPARAGRRRTGSTHTCPSGYWHASSVPTRVPARSRQTKTRRPRIRDAYNAARSAPVWPLRHEEDDGGGDRGLSYHRVPFDSCRGSTPFCCFRFDTWVYISLYAVTYKHSFY